jgi:hypothetical protein
MRTSARLYWVAAAAAAATVASCAAPASEQETPAAARPALTVAQVNAAQRGWCDALLRIAKTKADGGDYTPVAVSVLETNYNYPVGRVLFNPTLTFGKQNFRLDKEGAAAYFIGGNPNYPNDDGFALKPWVKCEIDNGANDDGVLIDGDWAFTMGNVTVTNASGEPTTVDKFWAFKRDEAGNLRIVVHKSSLPNPVPPGKQ